MLWYFFNYWKKTATFCTNLFSSAWQCQQSSWNRNSSIVVRTSVLSVVRLWHRLSLDLLHGFISNFSCCFSGPYARISLECLKKKMLFWGYLSTIFSFSLTYDPMGAKISKRYSSYKSQPNVSNVSWIFFPVVLTKLRLEFLKFWVSDF